MEKMAEKNGFIEACRCVEGLKTPNVKRSMH